ncbi:hypothetical protein ACFZDK_12390 [Streptomyces sp. NPDC007901]|uniref:hypothetical protein n=1 Tax=Streptomyces sp. NPDC007901 TaxID=3364785 RepID=UPI0036EFC28A
MARLQAVVVLLLSGLVDYVGGAFAATTAGPVLIGSALPACAAVLCGRRPGTGA